MLDLTKPVQTRDGQPVRIICTDRQNSEDFVVVGLVQTMFGEEATQTWRLDGSFSLRKSSEHSFDLINVPVKREGWINIYGDANQFFGNIYPSEAAAKEDRLSSAIATIKIEWEEPE